MSKQRSIGNGMSKDRATRFLVIGVILAVGFGTLLLISNNMAARADEWAAYEGRLNLENLNDNVVSDIEYVARAKEIALQQLWMKQQQLYLGSIGRIGVNIGLILVFIGFIGFGTNDQLDEHTRRTCIIIAGVIIFVMMISFVGSFGIFIGP